MAWIQTWERAAAAVRAIYSLINFHVCFWPGPLGDLRLCRHAAPCSMAWELTANLTDCLRFWQRVLIGSGKESKFILWKIHSKINCHHFDGGMDLNLILFFLPQSYHDFRRLYIQQISFIDFSYFLVVFRGWHFLSSFTSIVLEKSSLDILLNISFCVLQKKASQIGLKQINDRTLIWTTYFRSA